MRENFMKNFNEFLSTEQRKNIFLCYLFRDMAQSDVIEHLKKAKQEPSSSNVERVTSSLLYLGMLVKRRTEKNKQIYGINWHIWLQENFSSLGFKNVDEETTEKIEKVLKNELLITFYYCLMQPDTFKELLKTSINKMDLATLEKEGLPPEILLQYIAKVAPSFSYYPFFYIGVTGNPFRNLFKRTEKLTEEEDKRITELFNKALRNSVCELFIKKIDKKTKEKISKLFDSISQETRKLFISHIQKEIGGTSKLNGR